MRKENNEEMIDDPVPLSCTRCSGPRYLVVLSQPSSGHCGFITHTDTVDNDLYSMEPWYTGAIVLWKF
jgi:hypothetical protein